MDILTAIILSIVEGISEFLPISSTGHLVLASHLLNIPQTDFVKSFEIIIQLGAILAVVFLYWRKLLGNFNLGWKIFLAFIPSMVLGLLFYKIIKDVLIGNLWVTIIALFIGGIVLILFERFAKIKSNLEVENLSTKQALLIGLSQSVSMIPGVSRAAATIIGGMLVGLNKKQAVEFSFLLAIPTMFAATVLDLYKANFSFTTSEFSYLGVGFLGSFLTAILAVKFFIKYVSNHSFVAFGIYRIVIAVLFWLYFR